jgi:CRISPR-associated protein Csm1
MSLQIFVEGRSVGAEQFLLAPGDSIEQRFHWLALLTEVLPRAFLRTYNLPPILLGSSGGDYFLLVLPQASRPQAEEFFASAAADIERLTGGHLRLICSMTENLGEWPIVRRRLQDDFQRQLHAPATAHQDWFSTSPSPIDEHYFVSEMAAFAQARSVGWQPESPARILLDRGSHTWPLQSGQDAIVVARHHAPADDAERPASVAELARRASGRPAWGVLCGDVDNVALRFQLASSVEEHVALSVLYTRFFAGELQLICSQPDYWQRVSILYSGGDDFAVYGAWDALISLAREFHRVFGLFADTSLKDFPGPEGKTITMALAVAPDVDAPVRYVYEDALLALETAKASGRNCFYLFGRSLEWNRVPEADEARSVMTRFIQQYGCSPQFLYELAGFYREQPALRQRARGRNIRLDKPWRFHRRLNRVLGAPADSRDRDFARLRSDLINNFTGRQAAQFRLRPWGRVALEWTRLETEESNA